MVFIHLIDLNLFLTDVLLGFVIIEIRTKGIFFQGGSWFKLE